MAAKTLGQVLTYINEVLPNALNTTTIITFINDELRGIWKDATSTKIGEFNTVSSQYYYSLPTDCDFDMISENGLYIATSTGVPTSTFTYNKYSYAGDDEELDGYKYYFVPGGFMGVYPIPDKNYNAKLKYQARPTLFSSTNDSTTYFDIDQDSIMYLQDKVMAKVAKSGNAPDVDLANNYEMDAEEKKRKIRYEHRRERAKSPRIRWSYKEDWGDD